jgi:hypothetical protein
MLNISAGSQLKLTIWTVTHFLISDLIFIILTFYQVRQPHTYLTSHDRQSILTQVFLRF